MPTVEDYFDDDTDLPLPSSSKTRPVLPDTGLRGALLEEINPEDDDDDLEMDYTKLAEQGRGIFGEDSIAPEPAVSSGSKGKLAVRDQPGDLRPSGSSGGPPAMNPNTPMGGFMGDMMRLQEAEEERLERLRKQFGNATMAKDPSVHKAWNTVYPLYFDAKVSINDGRRVPRQASVWWPQATHISQACRSLGLPCALEPDKTHPADWENPGRVKVQFMKDGRSLNPIVKNRTQLYRQLADQIRQQNPSIAYIARPKTITTIKSNTTNAKHKSKGKSTSTTSTTCRGPTRPPPPPNPIPVLESRLPLHSPVCPAGVAVSSIQRDLENEKEAKKKGIAPPGEETKEKAPKMKRVVVRGKR